MGIGRVSAPADLAELAARLEAQEWRLEIIAEDARLALAELAAVVARLDGLEVALAESGRYYTAIRDLHQRARRVLRASLEVDTAPRDTLEPPAKASEKPTEKILPPAGFRDRPGLEREDVSAGDSPGGC